MVRVSGTENKIRVMCEGQDEDKCRYSAKEIEKAIIEINNLDE
jgi:phosphomannomutase